MKTVEKQNISVHWDLSLFLSHLVKSQRTCLVCKTGFGLHLLPKRPWLFLSDCSAVLYFRFSCFLLSPMKIAESWLKYFIHQVVGERKGKRYILCARMNLQCSVQSAKEIQGFKLDFQASVLVYSNSTCPKVSVI